MGNLLDLTLAAAQRDRQTVIPKAESAGCPLLDGVRVRYLETYSDSRGSVTELFDPRWNWHPEPMVFAYCFTLRPGHVKGWGLHRDHDDRYAILQGEMELVLFDPRPESSTYGQICRILLSEQRRSLVNVPRNVWHANLNISEKDVFVVNFPTSPYNHVNPDKYRLPTNTDLIPYSFGGAKGW